MKYIVLLRGINVSGKNKIKMAEFRALLEKSGFKDVETYIQSGNISFHTDINDSKKVEPLVHDLIERAYGYDVPVLALNSDYVIKIASSHSFNEDIDITKLHVTFLAEEPLEENLQKCLSYDYSPDLFKMDEMCMYVYCPNGYGRTKINNTFFEKKLKVRATTRNWKTVQKLKEMVNE